MSEPTGHQDVSQTESQPKEREIAVGDIVRLKSGGPNMTVNEVGQNENEGTFANCTWFSTPGSMNNGDPFWGDIKEAGFSIKSLVHVKEVA